MPRRMPAEPDNHHAVLDCHQFALEDGRRTLPDDRRNGW
jgi:hypothetical protein